MRLRGISIMDVMPIEPKVFRDDRGFFMETYHTQNFQAAGIPYTFVQDNHSGSHSLTLRGLHYQIHQAQGKLVRAIVGEILDVAVDLRRASPTFGRWTSEIISAQNLRQLWIPPGFAHGFLVLSKWTEIEYKATEFYAPEFERSLLWNDPDIGINWPIPAGATPIISAKDAQAKCLREAEVFN